jgi:hypothetical protein
MAGKVLLSIETGGDPLSANGSVLSDDTYVEEGTPEPNGPEARLSWGRKHNGEEWYWKEVADREAALSARLEEEKRERIEDEEVEAIRRLRETKPLEYERRMKEYNLRLQGLTKAQIDNANKPLPRKEAERIWVGFANLLGGKALQPATTDKHADAHLRPRKPTKEVSHTIRRGRIVKSTARNQPKRPTSTLAEALVDEESASNATNVKVSRSKHNKTRQRKAYKGERASPRLANKPVEYGIFAKRSMAPVPKHLQRNPSTRKRNPTGPRGKKKSIAVEPAKHRGALKSGRESTYRSRSKKESGG